MKKTDRIRILVVDDHFIVRMGLKASLGLAPDMVVVAEASNGQQAGELYRQHKPDVTLMDLRMPGMNGVETTAAILREFPDARIILLSTYGGDEDIYRAVHTGARSYLLKSTSREELLEAIRTVHGGQRFLPPAISARLAERLGQAELTARELEVLHLIVKGSSNKEAAAALRVTEVTVKIHVGNILEKLNVQDRTQAATAALQRGIIHLD